MAPPAGGYRGRIVMEIDINKLVWSVINFLVLFYLLRRFLWKPLLGIIEDREKEVASNLEGAENAREEALNMKAEYERRLAEAQQRAEEMITRAEHKAEELERDLKTKADAKAVSIMDRARTEIEREKARALTDLRDQVADMALAVAGKVLERSVTDHDNEKLARELVARVGEDR